MFPGNVSATLKDIKHDQKLSGVAEARRLIVQIGRNPTLLRLLIDH